MSTIRTLRKIFQTRTLFVYNLFTSLTYKLIITCVSLYSFQSIAGNSFSCRLSCMLEELLKSFLWAFLLPKSKYVHQCDLNCQGQSYWITLYWVCFWHGVVDQFCSFLWRFTMLVFLYEPLNSFWWALLSTLFSLICLIFCNWSFASVFLPSFYVF